MARKPPAGSGVIPEVLKSHWDPGRGPEGRVASKRRA
jgi:hypothetical protein